MPRTLPPTLKFAAVATVSVLLSACVPLLGPGRGPVPVPVPIGPPLLIPPPVPVPPVPVVPLVAPPPGTVVW